MKFSKSTTILLNVVLILVIALLVKSFITIPKNVYANPENKYLVDVFNYNDFQDKLNEHTKQGWRFHSNVIAGRKIVAVFER